MWCYMWYIICIPPSIEQYCSLLGDHSLMTSHDFGWFWPPSPHNLKYLCLTRTTSLPLWMTSLINVTRYNKKLKRLLTLTDHTGHFVLDARAWWFLSSPSPFKILPQFTFFEIFLHKFRFVCNITMRCDEGCCILPPMFYVATFTKLFNITRHNNYGFKSFSNVIFPHNTKACYKVLPQISNRGRLLLGSI